MSADIVPELLLSKIGAFCDANDACICAVYSSQRLLFSSPELHHKSVILSIFGSFLGMDYAFPPCPVAVSPDVFPDPVAKEPFCVSGHELKLPDGSVHLFLLFSTRAHADALRALIDCTSNDVEAAIRSNTSGQHPNQTVDDNVNHSVSCDDKSCQPSHDIGKPDAGERFENVRMSKVVRFEVDGTNIYLVDQQRPHIAKFIDRFAHTDPTDASLKLDDFSIHIDCPQGYLALSVFIEQYSRESDDFEARRFHGFISSHQGDVFAIDLVVQTDERPVSCVLLLKSRLMHLPDCFASSISGDSSRIHSDGAHEHTLLADAEFSPDQEKYGGDDDSVSNTASQAHYSQPLILDRGELMDHDHSSFQALAVALGAKKDAEGISDNLTKNQHNTQKPSPSFSSKPAADVMPFPDRSHAPSQASDDGLSLFDHFKDVAFNGRNDTDAGLLGVFSLEPQGRLVDTGYIVDYLEPLLRSQKNASLVHLFTPQTRDYVDVSLQLRQQSGYRHDKAFFLHANMHSANGPRPCLVWLLPIHAHSHHHSDVEGVSENLSSLTHFVYLCLIQDLSHLEYQDMLTYVPDDSFVHRSFDLFARYLPQFSGQLLKMRAEQMRSAVSRSPSEGTDVSSTKNNPLHPSHLTQQDKSDHISDHSCDVSLVSHSDADVSHEELLALDAGVPSHSPLNDELALRNMAQDVETFLKLARSKNTVPSAHTSKIHAAPLQVFEKAPSQHGSNSIHQPAGGRHVKTDGIRSGGGGYALVCDDVFQEISLALTPFLNDHNIILRANFNEAADLLQLPAPRLVAFVERICACFVSARAMRGGQIFVSGFDDIGFGYTIRLRYSPLADTRLSLHLSEQKEIYEALSAVNDELLVFNSRLDLDLKNDRALCANIIVSYQDVVRYTLS